MEKQSAVVLNFKTNGQIQYAKTIKDINSIMNAAAKEYRAQIKAMGDDATATDKLRAEKKKLETQLEAGRERTQKLREEFLKMQDNSKTTTAQLNNMYGKLKDSESAEASLESRLKKVNDGLTEQADGSRKNQNELDKLQQESVELEAQTEKLNSELKLQESAMGDNATEAEKAAFAQEKYGKQSELVEKQIANLEKQLEITKQEYGENSVEANRMEAELNEAKTAFNNLNNEMTHTKTSADSAQEGMGKLTSIMQSQAFLQASQQLEQISDKLIEIGKSSIETAATYRANEAQFDQVFGGMSGKAKSIVDDLGEQFGILPTRLKPAYASIASQFTSLGFDIEDAMKLSEDATTASADAAAFYDQSLQDATGRVQSFLKGNLSAAESIGIFASVATLDQYAVDNLGESYKDMDEKQKQALRMEYVLQMQDMAGATGQAAREMDGYENVMGNLESSAEDIKAALGEELLPMLLEVAQEIIPKISEFAAYIKEMNPIVKQLALGFAGVVVVVGQLLPIIAAIGVVVTTGMLPVIGVIAAIAAAIAIAIVAVKNWGTITEWVSEKWSALKDFLKEFFTGVKEDFNEFVGNMKDGWNDFWSGVFDKVSEAKDSISDKMSELKDSIVETFHDAKDSVVETVTGWKDAIAEKAHEIAESFAETRDEIVDKFVEIKDKVVEKFVEIKDGIVDAWNQVVDFLTPIVEQIVKIIMVPISLAQTIGEAIGMFIKAGMDIAMAAIKIAYDWIYEKVYALTTVLKEWVATIFEAISEKWQAIYDKTVEIFTAVGDWMSEKWQAIYDKTVEIFTAITDWFAQKGEELKQIALTIFEAFKENIVRPVTEAKNAVVAKFQELKQAAIDKFTEIKDAAVEKWQAIKSAIVDKFTETKDSATKTAGSILSNVIDKFEQLRAKVKDKFERVRDAIVDPLIRAKDKVKETIEAIKDFFFNMKLPKFGLKTSSKTILGKEITYPSGIDVKWNAKGGIFNKPTIFGASGGQLQGAGEAGSEAVLPLTEENLAAIGKGIPGNGVTIEQHNHFGKVDYNNPSERFKMDRELQESSRQAIIDAGGIPT